MKAANDTLRAIGVRRTFGGVTAVADVTLEFKRGEWVGLVGPNGAGKSTFINLLFGAERADGGRILLGEDELTRLGSHERVRRGMSRTFQIEQPVVGMTVGDLLTLAASRARERTSLERLISALNLGSLHHTLIEQLTGAQLKRLDIARALASNPDFLFLDEALAGLSWTEADQVTSLIRDLNASGLCVVMVEHNPAVIRRFCRRLVIIDRGQVMLDGGTEEVVSSRKAQELYFGEKDR